MSKKKEKELCKEEKCHCGDECDCSVEDKSCNCDDNCDCGCNEGTECSCHNEEDSFKKTIQELNDKYLRSQAELVNYRRRKDEETAKLLEYCNKDLILDILPVLDNFERAINMDDDNLDDEVSKFLEGTKMIYTSLRSVLDKFGVKEIDALGKNFDHNTMESVLVDCNNEKENDVVLEVLQKGYMLKERVIRPVMVKVNKNE